MLWFRFQRKLHEARAAEHGLRSSHHALWVYPLINVWNVNGPGVSQLLTAVVIHLDLHPPVIFQLQLLTTWGDPYYIGLNGLEFYDQKHEKITLSENSILY